MSIKVVCISDTHGRHNGLKVPEGDILIHSGDFSMQGTIPETKAFLEWFSNLSHKHKIFISGNHDWMGQKNPTMFKMLLSEYRKVTYLEDEFTVAEGLKIYGSPWQPEFCNWAYNLPRGPRLQEKWDLIPEDTDILVTHGPPYKILDYVHYDKLHVGCTDLIKRAKKLPKLKLQVFGHIHSMGGKYLIEEGVTYANASVLDEDYKLAYEPITLDIDL